MQTDDPNDSPTVFDGGAGHGMPYCPTGPGGNMILVNQDESEILEASYEGMAVREAPAGYRETGRH